MTQIGVLYSTISVLLFIILGGLVAFLIYKAITSYLKAQKRNRELLLSVTDLNRGTWSERDLILKLLKHGIPPITIFHDLYVCKPNGKYSQVDVVVPTKVGIIVFEVKDYSGWIFGNGYNKYWTQVLAYGQEKHRFYNPIKQNEGHIESLRYALASCALNVPLFSVIVFYGNCELREISNIPNQTVIVRPYNICNALYHILQTNQPALYGDKHEVVRILKQAVENGTCATVREQHISNINHDNRSIPTRIPFNIHFPNFKIHYTNYLLNIRNLYSKFRFRK